MLQHAVIEQTKAEGLRPFSRRIGVPLGVVRSAIKGLDLSGSNINALCKALGLEFYIGFPRTPENTALNGFAEKAAEYISPAVDGSEEALKQGFLPVPYSKHDPIRENQGVSPIAFARSWLIEQALHPDNLTIIEVPEDNMVPTLEKGALALINSAPAQGDNQIWAYLDGDKLKAARLSNLGGDGIIIAHDNHKYKPTALTGDKSGSVIRLGRVIWSGHILK